MTIPCAHLGAPRCWPCMLGDCRREPSVHPWWDADDAEHAAATGQAPPSGWCGCAFCGEPAVARRTIAAESPAEPLSATESSKVGSFGSDAPGPSYAPSGPEGSGAAEPPYTLAGAGGRHTEATEPPESRSGDLRTQSGPAERLRSAADALLVAAPTAPTDIWALTHVRATLHPWVALMAPDLAEPLAALLRDAADNDWQAYGLVMDLADAILGGVDRG